MKHIKEILSSRHYGFKGFSKLNYTQCPDQVFDYFLIRLTHSELKVLLYIVRRTLGFKKDADNISLRQICRGIIKKNGDRLDYGAGVNRSTAIRAIAKLKKKGLIRVERRVAESGRNKVSTYSLRFYE